jgi:hypothetical protein
MDHQLHPAGLVEEALDQNGIERRQGAERRASRREILDDLEGGLGRETHRLGQPVDGRARMRAEALLDLLPQARDGL